MIVAGIDQSFTFTGITIFNKETGELIKCIGLKSPKSYNKEQLLFDRRVSELTDRIIDFLIENEVEQVGIEALSLMSHSASSLVLAGLYYVILDKMQKNYIDYVKVPPKTLKAFVKHGNMKKPEMFELIPEIDKEKLIETGYKKTTGLMDLSDAYHLGHYLINNQEKLRY